jgi:hypothetical protein
MYYYICYEYVCVGVFFNGFDTMFSGSVFRVS